MEEKWVYCQPNLNEVYYIDVYDDGNEKYIKYNNRWNIYGKWKGKIALQSHTDKEIKIKSISAWKVLPEK